MKIFIGSSKESLGLAKKVAMIVETVGHTPIMWNSTGVFLPGNTIIESLENIADSVDAAIFIFSPDDKVWYRNGVFDQPRDNVILEYGIFSGRLGRKRVIICNFGKIKFATDMAGINTVRCDLWFHANEEIETWCNNLTPIEPAQVEFSRTEQTQYYTFCGLKQSCAVGEWMFQDFIIGNKFQVKTDLNDRVEGTVNINAISYLWAYIGSRDSSEINVKILKEIGRFKQFLRIYFNNIDSVSSNVAIRPRGEMAVKVPQGARKIVFHARKVEQTKMLDDNRNPTIGLRLINGFKQHWGYGLNPYQYALSEITSEEWQRVEFDLNDNNWWLFTSDGNYLFGPTPVNLEVIAGVVLEIGIDGTFSPGPGSGTLDISEIHFE